MSAYPGTEVPARKSRVEFLSRHGHGPTKGASDGGAGSESSPAPKVHFVSLGCPKNLVDSEVMLGVLAQRGATITDDPETADVAVVNTCAFIEASKKESVEAVLNLARLKEGGQLRKLVVTGCMAQRYPTELAGEIPEIDHLFGTGDLTRIGEVLGHNDPGRNLVGKPRFVPDHTLPRVRATPRHTAYLKISEGCSDVCSFCIIPQLRGGQRSRGVDDIVAEARHLADEGVVELNLVGQNLSRYGDDLKPGTDGLPPPDLARLLRALNRIDGLRWIRPHYLYPRYVTDELLDVMGECERVVKYVDMPIQHIDDGVLKTMRRLDTAESTRRVVERVRERLPEATLRTTVIVGHPGEDEAAFAQLLAYVEEGWFDRLGAFAYSQEEGTRAGALTNDDNPKRLREKRRRILMKAQEKVSRARLKALVGREMDLLVEGRAAESDLLVQGRTAGQAPGDIDGVTYLTDGPPEAFTPGRIVRARITRAHAHDLEAVAL